MGQWLFPPCNFGFKLTLRWFSDFTVEGQENIPKCGPLLVASNHLSNLDPAIVAAALPRPPVFLAKQISRPNSGIVSQHLLRIQSRCLSRNQVKRRTRLRRCDIVDWILAIRRSPDTRQMRRRSERQTTACQIFTRSRPRQRLCRSSIWRQCYKMVILPIWCGKSKCIRSGRVLFMWIFSALSVVSL